MTGHATTSPRSGLAVARERFDATLAAARLNDVPALRRIGADAEALLLAAEAELGRGPALGTLKAWVLRQVADLEAVRAAVVRRGAHQARASSVLAALLLEITRAEADIQRISAWADRLHEDPADEGVIAEMRAFCGGVEGDAVRVVGTLRLEFGVIGKGLERARAAVAALSADPSDPIAIGEANTCIRILKR